MKQAIVCIGRGGEAAVGKLADGQDVTLWGKIGLH